MAPCNILSLYHSGHCAVMRTCDGLDTDKSYGIKPIKANLTFFSVLEQQLKRYSVEKLSGSFLLRLTLLVE